MIARIGIILTSVSIDVGAKLVPKYHEGIKIHDDVGHHEASVYAADSSS